MMTKKLFFFSNFFSPSFFFFFSLWPLPLPLLPQKEIKGEMESVVQCCVCNGKKREPIKTLPCLHSACLQCLKSYAAKSLRDDHDQADSNCNAAPITCIEGGGKLNLLSLVEHSLEQDHRVSQVPVSFRDFR